MFRALARRLERSRTPAVIGVALATLLAIVGIVRLEYDDVPRTIFRSDDVDFARLEEVFRQFGADDADCVLLVEAETLFAPQNVAALRRLVERVRETPRIASVESLADIRVFPRRVVPRLFEPLARAVPAAPLPLLPAEDSDHGLPSAAACAAARAKALEHPLTAGQLVSDDGGATLVVARLAGDDLPVKHMAPVVDRLQSLADEFERDTALTIRLTGLAPIRVEIFESIRAESVKFVLFGGGSALAMAAWMFRRPAAIAIVCLAALSGAAWTVGAMGLFGERMNIITTVLPTLMLIIGFTDAVHLMIDIRRERARGATPRQAAFGALRHLGHACFLCAATTAVGFGSLAVARIEVIQHFGVVCGVGALLALAAVVTIVPLAASTRLGERLHCADAADLPERMARTFEPLVRRIVDRPRLSAGLGIAATLAMSTSLFLLVPSNQSTEALPSTSPAFTAVAELDRRFGGSGSAMIVVDWDSTMTYDSRPVLTAVEEAQTFAAAHADVSRPSSIVNLIRALPGEGRPTAERAAWLKRVPDEALAHFVRPDLRRAIIRLRLKEVGSEVHQATFADLRRGLTDLEAKHPGIRFHLTGTSVLASRNLNQMIVDLASSLGSAAAVIFVVMALGFRSLRLGLISVIPNVFPLVATATFLVVTGRPLQMTSVVVFSICLGIAVDDTIHFVNRFQRELRVDGDVRAAVLRSYRAVGSAMIVTSLVLLVGFAGLQTSSMPTTRLFSSLSCLTIGAALLGDLLILPALLVCFARRPRTAAAVRSTRSREFGAAA